MKYAVVFYKTKRCYASFRRHDPLRILFCGSDEFSIASLDALHAEYVRNKNRIASIDVVCRPGKPVGRGLRSIREVPIANGARRLDLPLHQIDTFRGWQPPQPEGLPVNLVIAVSFGLLVPPRILGVAKYGGLNVHPSILPDLRGPAPLHHTLLNRRQRTGVTVQTLHPKSFDQGEIVAQTPLPGFEHGCHTVPELLQVMASECTRMLSNCINSAAFLPPYNDFPSDQDMQHAVSAAPKITPHDRHIDWATWTADEILLRQRVIGPLWSLVSTDGPSTKRIIWSFGLRGVECPTSAFIDIGQPFIDGLLEPDQFTYIKTCDGKFIQVTELKVEGHQSHAPVRSAKQARIFSGDALHQINKHSTLSRARRLLDGDLS